MEVFDRSLTNIPIELHTKYLSNFHIKYISSRSVCLVGKVAVMSDSYRFIQLG
jgi:hypothetical protein